MTVLNIVSSPQKLGSSGGKASAYNAGDPSSIPGSGRSSGAGNGNPLQYSYLENGWRSAVGYSPCSCKELDTTERLHLLVSYKSPVKKNGEK